MAGGQEETSTSHVGRKRGTPQEMLTTSSLVAAMSIEDLRSFSQVHVGISLELSNGVAVTTTRGTDNVVYFTQEQFATRIRFPIPSLVKQFLHFIRVLPALIHPNVFWILMGCSVLNFLYQLNISPVGICFIYTLKLGDGGRLSMSAHSPQLEFVIEFLNSRETEAKGVVLVKGLWYETLVSLFFSRSSVHILICLSLWTFCR